MKVSRFKVAVLVLLAVTVICAVAFCLDIQGYEAWKRSYLQSHPDWAPLIDFNPYIGTFTGGLLISIAAFLGICWVTVVVKNRRKLKSWRKTRVEKKTPRHNFASRWPVGLRTSGEINRVNRCRLIHNFTKKTLNFKLKRFA